jgi:autotransporter-associated beta strand protein
MSKTGAGALTITGYTTYSGGTFVNGGTLLLGSSGSLPAAGAVTLNGGMLGPGADPAMVINNPILIGPASGSGFYSRAGANFSVGGVVGGSQLTKSGSGDVTLSAANTFAGANITGGVLRFTTDANLGAPGAAIVINGGSIGTTTHAPAGMTVDRNIDLQGAGGVDVAASPLTWSGAISGSGQFIKSGAGELDLASSFNTYSGGTNVAGGTLGVSSDGQLGKDGSPLALNGGALHALGSFTNARPITLGVAGGAFNIDANKIVTLNGPIIGGALIKDGAGTLALGVVQNGYSDTFVKGGALIGNSDSLPGNIANNGLVSFSQDFDGAYAGNLVGPGNLEKFGTGNLTLGA